MSLQEGVGLEIEHAEYEDNYRIAMEFSDGHRTVVDFESFLSSSSNTETRRFLDTARFRDFRLEWGNIVWGDYELCFPVEDLYTAKLIRKRLLAVAEERATYGHSKD